MSRETESSLAELRECYDLLLKTARRCARDLNHAIAAIPDKLLADEFRDRHRHYVLVLGGTEDYRVGLHHKIEQLESLLAKDGETPF